MYGTYIFLRRMTNRLVNKVTIEEVFKYMTVGP